MHKGNQGGAPNMHTPTTLHNNLVDNMASVANELDPSIVQFVQTYEPAKYASKRNGVVASYAANTH